MRHRHGAPPPLSLIFPPLVALLLGLYQLNTPPRPPLALPLELSSSPIPPTTQPLPPYPLSWPSRRAASLSFHRETLLTIPSTLLAILKNNTPHALICAIPTASTPLLTHLTRTHTLQPLSAFSLRDRERLLQTPTIIRFALIRHPLTRLKALHTAAITAGLHSTLYANFMTDVRGIPLQPAEHEVNPVSFRFLVSILSRRRPLPPRFQSQTRLCAMTYVKYDVLLRYEDMTTAIRIVNARLGIHGAHVVTEGDGIQSMHDVNPHVAARVNRLYADDVRNFGYA